MEKMVVEVSWEKTGPVAPENFKRYKYNITDLRTE